MLSLILTTDNFRLFIIQSDPGHILMEEEIITTEALRSYKNSFPREFSIGELTPLMYVHYVCKIIWKE